MLKWLFVRDSFNSLAINLILRVAVLLKADLTLWYNDFFFVQC